MPARSAPRPSSYTSRLPTVRAPPARPSAGAHITGVDNITYSSTGEAFSTIGASRANRSRTPNPLLHTPPLTRPYPCAVLPKCESTREKSLQSDDVSLAYEFAKKFPGYTSQ